MEVRAAVDDAISKVVELQSIFDEGAESLQSGVCVRFGKTQKGLYETLLNLKELVGQEAQEEPAEATSDNPLVQRFFRWELSWSGLAHLLRDEAEVDAALSPDTLALVLLAMVRLKWKASPQLAGLVARRSAEGASPTLSRMDPEELSQLAWSFARLRFQPGPDWQMAFEEHALRCAFRFNLLHISKTFFAFSRFRDPMAPDLWLALQRRARALAVRGSDLVASVFTNMVKTRLRADPVLVKELAGLLARDLEAVCRSRDTMAASNFLWALTQVPRGADLAAEQWAQIDGAFEGTGVLESMRDQELCISLWAFARLGQLPSPGLLRQFEACVLDRVGSLSATDLVTVVHAYATLEHAPSPELLEALERGVGRQTRKLSPRQVANVLWGWAKLGHQPRRQALESLSARALETLGKFSGQNLSNTLWAFASLERLPGEAFLEAFDAAAARELTRASPQAHANIMWSYARLGVRPSAELMDLSDEIMTVKIRAYSPLNIAHVVWAYAKLNHCPDIPLLEACEEAIGSKFRQFNARDFSNTLWGLRKMEYRLSFRLLQEIEGAFLDTLDRGGATDQDIALVMWAYARSDFSLAQASVDRLVAAATEKLAARFDLDFRLTSSSSRPSSGGPPNSRKGPKAEKGRRRRRRRGGGGGGAPPGPGRRRRPWAAARRGRADPGGFGFHPRAQEGRAQHTVVLSGRSRGREGDARALVSPGAPLSLTLRRSTTSHAPSQGARPRAVPARAAPGASSRAPLR